MKILKNLIFLSVLFSALPMAVAAQAPSGSVLSMDYANNPAAERSKHWWRALQEEVNLPRESNYTDVTMSELQDIIFFATVHGDKVDFRASVPQLLDVYKYHEVEGMRTMALAALHAIGSSYGMEGLREAVQEQESPALRRLTLRALHDYQNQQLAAK